MDQDQKTTHEDTLTTVIKWTGVLVTVLILGWWFMSQRAVAPMPITEGTMPTEAMMKDPAVSAMQTQGTSDEVADIEKDLNATDLNTLDVSAI